MKIIIILMLLTFTTISKRNNSDFKKLDSCVFNGKKLYGKVQLVATPGEADVKVKIVNSFSDIKVKFVENSPNACGMWQIVENGADLKVYITENFPDLKIMPVTSFPGITN